MLLLQRKSDKSYRSAQLFPNRVFQLTKSSHVGTGEFCFPHIFFSSIVRVPLYYQTPSPPPPLPIPLSFSLVCTDDHLTDQEKRSSFLEGGRRKEREMSDSRSSSGALEGKFRTRIGAKQTRKEKKVLAVVPHSLNKEKVLPFFSSLFSPRVALLPSNLLGRILG